MAVKGQMVLLTPPPGDAPPGAVIWGNGIYAVPRGPALMIGATVEDIGFDSGITAEARESLRSAAEKSMPGLRRWHLSDHWAGLRPRAPDGLPLLGPTGVDGLWLASGQYRNGILFAPAVAQTLCDQILGLAPLHCRFRSPQVCGMSFDLHPRLEADTVFIADWPLCRVLLMNDARYPWLILVPRRDGLIELMDLTVTDRALLTEEAARAGDVVRGLPGVTKLNLGALGNLVPQFHVHVVGRHAGDPAWPSPVWGHSPALPYEAAARDALLALVRSL